MTKICITGLTATKYGGAYEQNRGNMAILIPMCQMLRKRIPDAELFGHLQLLESSKQLCHYRSILHPTMRPMWRRVGWRWEHAKTLMDLARVRLWRFFRDKLGWNTRLLIAGSRLAPFRDTDIVLFFNGDIFGDNSEPRRLRRFALDMLVVAALGKPSMEYVGSPGPFRASSESRAAKRVLERLSLVLTREALSADLLREGGVSGVPIVTAACPAFLLEPAPPERVSAILEEEGLNFSGPPTIGMNLTAHNFGTSGGNIALETTHQWASLKNYARVLQRILDETEANVLLIPHAYYYDPNLGKDVQKNDYTVLQRLYELVDGDRYGKRLRILKGIYSVAELKGILGRLDMYVGGRMHSAIGASSQCVPTVFLAYGHKHRGITRLLKQEKCVCFNQEADDVWAVVRETWTNRDQIRRELNETVPVVKRQALRSFDIVAELLTEAKTNDGILPSKPDQQRLQNMVDAE